eukprot:Platyproteum_vivax@DN2335_c0_g1_i1.p1
MMNYCIAVILAVVTLGQVSPILANETTVRGGMSVASLKIAPSSSKNAFVKFGEADKPFTMGVKENSDFHVSKGDEKLLSIGADNVAVIVPKLTVTDLELEGDLSIKGVKQWRMVQWEHYTETQTPQGWDNNVHSQCAGVFMLGGHCRFAQGEVTKTFADLPVHTHLRVKATYHFIDGWIGETGFMRLNVGNDGSMLHVWTERHSQDMEQKLLNLCGNEEISEGKFAVPVDVAVPHTSNSIVIGFGSSMDSNEACNASWGVSNIEIYVK